MSELAERKGSMVGVWMTKADKDRIKQWARGRDMSLSKAGAHLMMVGLEMELLNDREIAEEKAYRNLINEEKQA